MAEKLKDKEFVLKRKTDVLDDWNGDIFEDIYEINRSDILNSNIEHIKIGIQNHNILNVDTKKPKKNKNQYILRFVLQIFFQASTHLL